MCHPFADWEAGGCGSVCHRLDLGRLTALDYAIKLARQVRDLYGDDLPVNASIPGLGSLPFVQVCDTILRTGAIRFPECLSPLRFGAIASVSSCVTVAKVSVTVLVAAIASIKRGVLRQGVQSVCQRFGLGLVLAFEQVGCGRYATNE